LEPPSFFGLPLKKIQAFSTALIYFGGEHVYVFICFGGGSMFSHKIELIQTNGWFHFYLTKFHLTLQLTTEFFIDEVVINLSFLLKLN